jgi:microcystin-dependent protein
MAEPFLSEIRLFSFTFPPKGWAFCNGQVLSIAQNTALFSLLGTTYGGNGTTNFMLPNLQGRAITGWGQGAGLSPLTLGQVGGQETSTVTLAAMPAHLHPVTPPVAATASMLSPNGTVPGLTASVAYGSPTTGAHGAGFATTAAGSGVPVSVADPHLTLNYCIALQGIFPSRS